MRDFIRYRPDSITDDSIVDSEAQREGDRPYQPRTAQSSVNDLTPRIGLMLIAREWLFNTREVKGLNIQLRSIKQLMVIYSIMRMTGSISISVSELRSYGGVISFWGSASLQSVHVSMLALVENGWLDKSTRRSYAKKQLQGVNNVITVYLLTRKALDLVELYNRYLEGYYDGYLPIGEPLLSGKKLKKLKRGS